MRILVAGSSGFLGQRLCARLRAGGHEVTALVRRSADADEMSWDPYATDAVERVVPVVDAHDAVVNLAGSPTMGNPHSKKWAEQLRHSRVRTTHVLAEAIAGASGRPAFIAGNGISWYGDHGDEIITETADSRGDALLARVTREWQGATGPAEDAGARVVVLRTAPVMDRQGPPLRELRLLFSLCLGGPMASGRQYFPVISLPDWLAAAEFAITHDSVAGPANLCCPQTPTNAEFTAALAAAVHRPARLRVPAAVIRRAAGAMAPEVLNSLRTVPRTLLDAGFTFADTDVTAVLATGLRQRA